MAGLRAGPSERIAGLSFLLFTLMQVPYFAMRNTTIAGWSSMVLLSPLQITAATIASRFPEAAPAAEAALLPGAWAREALTPLVRCKFTTQGGPCERERRLLFDFDRVKRRVQLPSLVALVESKDFAPGSDGLTAGAALITLSAALSLVVTVKSAVAGFVFMALGIIQGSHEPLAPGVLVAFLCVYSGFGLGEGRERRQAAKDRERRELRQAARGGGGAVASGSSKADKVTPAKGKASKTRRA